MRKFNPAVLLVTVCLTGVYFFLIDGNIVGERSRRVILVDDNDPDIEGADALANALNASAGP